VLSDHLQQRFPNALSLSRSSLTLWRSCSEGVPFYAQLCNAKPKRYVQFLGFLDCIYQSKWSPKLKVWIVLTVESIGFSRSKNLIQQYGITHVLSLVDMKHKPAFDEELGIQHLHCEIEDNPFEDLLMVLDGLCSWITNALARSPEHRVIVHCMQGISRSGAIVVACLMRTHILLYDLALTAVQKSRAIILPNSGFADQLRLCKDWKYSIIEEDEAGAWKIKTEYKYWRDNRGVLLSNNEREKQEAIRKRMIQLAVDTKQHL
jgi:dual specificity phosphatase 12